AAGCQLVASCDLAVASEQSWFATPGVKIGLFCTTPMVPLMRAIPPKVAMEMLMTGEPLAAQRAYELGLINRVVPLSQLEDATRELATKIASASRDTVAIGKSAFYQQASYSEADAYSFAVEVMTDNSMRPDAKEGISAFLEKRDPVWKP
ncbi:enoyl-CoA hydratase-related protein, partial [Rhodopirellula sallentina]|uniref:enoyl-CoA hydratase-related protein n=1 Tax=Rhodopirellula sallentina TaxID=1263869 RepID=UPI0005C7C869